MFPRECATVRMDLPHSYVKSETAACECGRDKLDDLHAPETEKAAEKAFTRELGS